MAAPAFSQERQDNPHDENYKATEELSQPIEPLNKEISRDSVIVKPLGAPRTKTDNPLNKKKEEEETLSFNFLYFIIQKFKVSDITSN